MSLLMSAAQRLQIGAVRFVCWVTPAPAVYDAARKRGWTPANACGASDYVDFASCERGHSFSTLEAAVAFGCRWCAGGQDWWGAVHIYRETFRADRITGLLEWKRDHEWIVSDTGVDQDEAVGADDEWEGEL